MHTTHKPINQNSTQGAKRLLKAIFLAMVGLSLGACATTPAEEAQWAYMLQGMSNTYSSIEENRNTTQQLPPARQPILRPYDQSPMGTLTDPY